jgi:hypothetical protein
LKRPTTNQEAALKRFLDDPRLPIHNNISELHLRRQAVGRKAWLFVGSEDGAQVNTRFVSLLASCAMHRIEPWAYLRDLFCLLPGWPVSKVLELAPVELAAAAAQRSRAARGEHLPPRDADRSPARRGVIRPPPAGVPLRSLGSFANQVNWGRGRSKSLLSNVQA